MKRYLTLFAVILVYVHGSNLFVSSTTPIIDSVHANTNNSISLISFNVEAGYKPDSELNTVLSLIDKLPASHVYAITELTPSWAESIAIHLGDFHYVINQNARESSDAMAIFYDPSRLTIVEAYERPFNVHKYERSMLYSKFIDKRTAKSFAVITNHFMRGTGKVNERRQSQSIQLQKWVQNQVVPVIALGDYNFDYDIDTLTGNPSYYLFTEDDHWQWVKPKQLIKTGCHKSYNSILDFVFIAGEVKAAASEIMFPETEYCNDDKRKPDHRPLYAVVEL